MKIICIGRNYAEHARELNNPVNEQPVVFMKPESARLLSRQPFFIPELPGSIHFEAEIVVKINRLGKNIPEKFAHRYYDEVTVGIDFTARDMQSELKKKGLPWELAKAFDGSAAIGTFIPLEEAGPVTGIDFSLKKNGTMVQNGNTSYMLFPVDTLISYVSRYFTLKKGDVLFTGTPAGVGPVDAGDLLEGFINDKKLLNVRVR
ncbi:MAG TPA: fumarylacetoacetate hydrolase family protein [Bacteroidia bacterium]|nr:fumarylacetoacetate hydrolase family protein [Bacteroidia bacterium]